MTIYYNLTHIQDSLSGLFSDAFPQIRFSLPYRWLAHGHRETSRWQFGNNWQKHLLSHVPSSFPSSKSNPPLPFQHNYKFDTQHPCASTANPYGPNINKNPQPNRDTLSSTNLTQMELRSLAAHLSLLIALLLACAAAPPADATKFTVGDAKAWNPNVNYTKWVDKHKPFYKGDWLVFYYTNGMADVVQVDEAAYNKCDASHPIANYSKGRSYAFELNETKRYYFICSYGYCYQGMKLTLRAEKLPPPSPPPKPSAAVRSPSPAVAFLFAALMFRFLF